MKLHRGDCIEVMEEMEDNSVHAIVCDPPYELTSGKNNKKGFMGKEWDTTGIAMRPEVWKECLRVAKPGAFLLSFGGTRTFHKIACAIEDAGWTMINTLNWLYGSGFPKNADISKGMDKSAGARREVVGKKKVGMGSGKTFGMLQAEGDNANAPDEVNLTAPATPEAKQWDGFGTALKPAWEPILMFQKPIEGAMSDEVRKITGWKRWYVYNGRWSWIGKTERDWKESDVYKACKKHGLEWWEEEKDGEFERFIYRRRWDSLVPWGQGRHSLIGKNGRVVLKRWPYRNKKRINNVANILKWGVGGLNLGGCKIGKDSIQINRLEKWSGFGQEKRPNYTPTTSKGRWPSNVILSHTIFCEKDGHADPDGFEIVEDWNCVDDCPVRMLDEQSGESKTTISGTRDVSTLYGKETKGKRKGGIWATGGAETDVAPLSDKGGASRFFYCTKAMPQEKNVGLGELNALFEKRKGFEKKIGGGLNATVAGDSRTGRKTIQENNHPTVKPIPLLRYLCRLVCPPGGTVLDCFAGSGSTGCATTLEGLDFIGIEKEEDYFKIAEARIKHFKEQCDAACK